MKPLYGLLGRRLGHSFSQKFFAGKFSAQGIDASYRNFEIENIEQLPALLASTPALLGFNVTIPYKEVIIPYLDALDPEAREVGAVNCVKITDGRLIGYNTDAYGFRTSLLELIGDRRPQALVLGTGGAAKAVEYVLRQLGIEYITVSRTPKLRAITYDQVTPELLSSHRLIVNATPMGMFPNTETAPAIPYRALTPEHFLFDLVYNPPVTKFLAFGRERNSSIMNGQPMLEAQAERSWDIWNA